MNALRVVRGAPSEAELAAVVASITALQAAVDDAPPADASVRPSAWSDRARVTRGAGGLTGARGWRLTDR